MRIGVVLYSLIGRFSHHYMMPCKKSTFNFEGQYPTCSFKKIIKHIQKQHLMTLILIITGFFY